MASQDTTADLQRVLLDAARAAPGDRVKLARALRATAVILECPSGPDLATTDVACILAEAANDIDLIRALADRIMTRIERVEALTEAGSG